MMLVDHALHAQGGIHLADAAFLDDDLAALEDLSELLQLTVHCYYDSYFHLLMYFCPSLI